MTDLNPQAKQMADESMVRNLAAQAQAIWPQEAPLFRRYTLPASPRILDAGCGTGEGASRLADNPLRIWDRMNHVPANSEIVRAVGGG